MDRLTSIVIFSLPQNSIRNKIIYLSFKHQTYTNILIAQLNVLMLINLSHTLFHFSSLETFIKSVFLTCKIQIVRAMSQHCRNLTERQISGVGRCGAPMLPSKWRQLGDESPIDAPSVSRGSSISVVCVALLLRWIFWWFLSGWNVRVFLFVWFRRVDAVIGQGALEWAQRQLQRTRCNRGYTGF